jgi:hypothetical protein
VVFAPRSIGALRSAVPDGRASRCRCRTAAEFTKIGSGAGGANCKYAGSDIAFK